ncbi:MAG: hypothetical protein Fur0037_02090 [Planctomycetota bacterium]
MPARPFALLLSFAFVFSAARAQAVFASRVIAYDTRGGAGGGIFNPSLALGPPAGPLHVHSLGIGGSLTLGFPVAIEDGPGADLIVSENCFPVGAMDSFAEVAFVEVSSNGTDFARFPCAYFGPQVDPGPYGTVPVGLYENLTGQSPALAPGDPAADPEDVVEAGGDAFDLSDLSNDPLVLQRRVDLSAIAQVRIVDAVTGVSLDGRGVRIRDAGAGSADIDAVTALHHANNHAPNGPSVQLAARADGTLTLRLEDPDGWQDLDPSSLRCAVWGRRLPAGALLSALAVRAWDATGITLEQPFPLPPALPYRLSFSLKDRAGHRSGASRSRPDR